MTNIQSSSIRLADQWNVSCSRSVTKALRIFSIVRQVASEDGSIELQSLRTLSQLDAGWFGRDMGDAESNDEENSLGCSRSARHHGRERFLDASRKDASRKANQCRPRVRKPNMP